MPSSPSIESTSSDISSIKQGSPAIAQVSPSTKAPGLAEIVPTSTRMPSESVLVFATTLPSDLPAQLSTVRLNKPSPTEGKHTLTASNSEPGLSGQAHLTHSFIGVLTSAGLPPSVVSSLAPVIIGSPSETGFKPSSSDIEIEKLRQEAAINAVIQWILSFFHLNSTYS